MFRAFAPPAPQHLALGAVASALVAFFVLFLLAGAIYVAWDYGRVTADVRAPMTAPPAAQVEPVVRYYVPGVYVIGVRAPAGAPQSAVVDRGEGVRYAQPSVAEDAQQGPPVETQVR
ncbi:MAG: hypothetical protein EP329_09790 [Deltaproteobacteria bacterium]|nr:MAG: hypothetical protein EP329_09790 [Deltaproteobacteria bacterium]